MPLRPLLLLLAMSPLCHAGAPDQAPALRVATYNVSLNHDEAGGLIAQLEGDHLPARQVAAVIQRVRPDLLLLNEFDHDADGRAARLFVERYLGQGQFGESAIAYPHVYAAPVNTGVPSGLDLDGDGRTDGPGDAWGFGRHPGQYGMLVLSRHPIDRAAVRTFQQLRWSALPGALAPLDAKTGKPWYPAEVWSQLRLSSKSHWDVPVETPQGRLHFLVAHPTPPVFDGPEDRNGRRNHDEIRLWAEYVSGQDLPWLCDDAGHCGGLPGDARFVIAGDYNADPADGDSHGAAILQLLEHPRLLRHPTPRSEGAIIAARDNEAEHRHRGNPAHDTGNFGPRTGNLRIDYVLPSVGFSVLQSGVFWPPPDAPEAPWIEASDHRMVWLDIVVPSAATPAARKPAP
ncbi:MAG: endonuclease/exonuclease/phosphatase family protein [Lysobacteraceae bacterium]